MTATLEHLHIVWLTGACCDGCTIKALGDTTAGGIEALLRGAPGLPRIDLVHPILSFETGEAWIECLRRAVRGEADPFGLVVEASVPREELAGTGYFSAIGEEDGRPVSVATWLDRLAVRAAFVVAWGDCAVWGGPHSLGPNPSAATGVVGHLGLDYRSTLGLPVVNLPGCAPPPVLVATLLSIIRWMRDEGPRPALDETGRPVDAYDAIWKGAFVAWHG